MSSTETREQLIRDAERIRKRLEEVKALAKDNKDSTAEELAAIAIDHGAMQRKHGVKTLELVEEVHESTVSCLANISTLNTQGLELDLAVQDIKEQQAKMTNDITSNGERVAQAVRTANLAKTSSASALNTAQQAQLEASMRWMVVKNIPLPAHGGKETYRDRFNGVMKMITELEVRNVQIFACHRLPAKPGTGVIPHMRVQVGGEIQRQLVFEGIDAAIKSRVNDRNVNTPFPYAVSADVPQYAKNKFKELNKLAVIYWENHKGARTRVAMRGAWPTLCVRPTGKQKYEPIEQAALDQLRSISRGLKEAQKRKHQEPMQLDPGPSSSSGAAGPKKSLAAPRASARLKSKDN